MPKRLKGQTSQKEQRKLGKRSGLVGKGGDSCSQDCNFESQHRILDGLIFYIH